MRIVIEIDGNAVRARGARRDHAHSTPRCRRRPGGRRCGARRRRRDRSSRQRQRRTFAGSPRFDRRRRAGKR